MSQSKIIFNIATVQRRKNSFIKVLCCLANQRLKCDVINVAASYDKPDEEIESLLKLKFKSHTIKYGDFTAIEKMYALENCPADSYFFSVDDDIEYTVDYAESLVHAIDSYGRKAVVGYHGKSFKSFPVTNYYDEENRNVYQYFKRLDADKYVHVIGTGVCAFYVKTLFDNGLTENQIFKEGLKRGHGNYNDMIFAKYLRERGIPMIVLKHPSQWLRPVPGSQTEDALWKQKKAKGRTVELSFLTS